MNYFEEDYINYFMYDYKCDWSFFLKSFMYLFISYLGSYHRYDTLYGAKK